MPVDTRAAVYEYMAPKWKRVRDSIEGEDAIKAAGKAYLPIPAGIDQPWGENDPQYLNYVRRAVYPEVIAPTVQGMVGLMSRKEVQIDLPGGMEDLREEATPEGLDLDGLLRRTQHEVMAMGRYVLFVDAPADGGEPYIATYPAESLINWRTDGDRLTMAVFEERVTVTKPDDPFADDEEEDSESEETAAESATDAPDNSGESMNTNDIPYVLRRTRVKDERPHEHVAFLRDEYHQLETDLLSSVADELDKNESDVSKLDLREALVELGDRHPDELARILDGWGYEHR